MSSDWQTISVFLATTFLIAGAARAESGPTLKVFPAEIELSGREDRQSVVVQSVDAQGTTRDVTGEAKFRLADPKLGDIQGQTLAPKADGQTRLVIEHRGQKVEVPVVVKDASQSRAVSFRLDAAACRTADRSGGASQRTVVLAKYSDGSVRDVTRLALFLTNNEAVAATNPTNELEEAYFSHSYVRRLRAEVLLDTISQKVAQSRLIATMISQKKPPEEILEELYVCTLSRKPTADETQKLVAIVHEDINDPDRVGAFHAPYFNFRTSIAARLVLPSWPPTA